MGHPCPPPIAGEEENQPSSSTTTKKVLFEKYELGKLLGCGAFAKVYHAREVGNGQSVAIKCFNKNKIVKSNLTSNITTEISIMRWLRHPNIVRLFEVLASRNKIYFVMEFVKGGELFSRLETVGRCSENLARRYFRQLVSAIGYCHARGVFHRDLKPENLLIDENGDLKITDFGLSAMSDQLRQDGMFHTLCGTPAYVAPEILSRKGYDGAKVDIWSCGVILFVLVAGYLPFNDSNLMAMYRKIYRGEYKCPKWASSGLKHLISRLLDTNPSTRTTVDGILNDPWFRKDLSEKEFSKLSNFHNHGEAEEKKMKKKVEVEVNREMNAFDIISLSPGFNLSGLFEPGPSRERFLCGGPVEEALGKLEREWTKEDTVVKRRVEDEVLFGLEVRDRTGRLVLSVEVHRFNRDMLVVEVDSFRKEWEARFRPALDGLRCEPVSTTVES